MSLRSVHTRTGILQAARTLIERVPFADVTLGRVASEAGVSRQAVYLHFGSRTQLLLDLVAWIEEQGPMPGLAVSAASLDGPAETLLDAIRAVADYNADVADVGLALRAARRSDPAAARAWDDRLTGRLTAILGAIRPVAEAGQLRAEWDPDTASDAIFALTSLTVYEDLVRERGWPHRRYVEHLVGIARHTFLVEGR